MVSKNTQESKTRSSSESTDGSSKEPTRLPPLSSMLKSPSSRKLPVPKASDGNSFSCSSISLPHFDTITPNNSFKHSGSEFHMEMNCSTPKKNIKSHKIQTEKINSQQREHVVTTDSHKSSPGTRSKDQIMTKQHKEQMETPRVKQRIVSTPSSRNTSQSIIQPTGSFYANATMYPAYASPAMPYTQQPFMVPAGGPYSAGAPVQMIPMGMAMTASGPAPPPGMGPMMMPTMMVSPRGNTRSFSMATPAYANQPTTLGRKRSNSGCNSGMKRREKKYAFISHNQATFLSSEPSIDNARLARRKRRRTSPAELAILKSEFKKGTTPNRARRREIAKRVDMSEKAVQIWFQNRRQALRKSKIVKRMVVEVPKREELDRSLLVQQQEATTDDGNATVTDSNRTSPENSPAKAIGSTSFNTSISVLANSTTARSIFSDRGATTATAVTSTNQTMDTTPVKHVIMDTTSPKSNTRLPPTGLFVTPSKADAHPTNSAADVSTTSNTSVTTPVAPRSSSTPLTFRFRSTDFFMMNPSQRNNKRQRPTMRVQLHRAATRSVLQDKTNISNNVHSRIPEMKVKNTTKTTDQHSQAASQSKV